MKNSVKFILSILLTICIFSSAFSQTTGAYLIIHKTNDKVLTQNTNGEKTMMFDIAGLTTKDKVDSLINTIKTLRGVVSASVNEASADGTWKATVVFYKYATKRYFKDFFNWCGITKVVLDNITYDAQSFEIIE